MTGDPTRQKADEQRLRTLESRLDAIGRDQAGEDTAKTLGDEYSQASMAWRMVTELVVGMALGFGIGYGMDGLFGTRPVFLILFALLGFAAGIRVMLRTAQEARKREMD